MADTFRTEDLDKLVLVWLVVPRKKPTLKGLGKVLDPFVRGTGASSESVARQCLARLKTRGDIERDTTWILTPAGKAKAFAALSVPNLPKRLPWKWVHTLLVARGNGTEPAPAALKRVASADGLVADVLQRQLGIQSRATPSSTQMGYALAWRELGIESTERFSLNAVLAHVVQKTCPGEAAPKDLKMALQILVAAALDVPRGDAPLRAALVRRWMGGPRSAEPTSASPTAAPDGPAALRTFAERVMVAVRASPTGRWGENKVFVSHVWNDFLRREGSSGMDLEAFKRLLLDANQAGHLSLSRADLVEVMDGEDVKRSEISSLGATFHFIRTD